MSKTHGIVESQFNLGIMVIMMMNYHGTAVSRVTLFIIIIFNFFDGRKLPNFYTIYYPCSH